MISSINNNNNVNFGMARRAKHAPRTIYEACMYMQDQARAVNGVSKTIIGETVTRDGTVARIFIDPNGSHYVEPRRYRGEVVKKFFKTICESLSKGKCSK